MSQRSGLDIRVLVGILIVLAGGFLLLRNLDFLDFTIPSVLFQWQSIIIIIGLILIAGSSNRSTGYILIVIGGIGFYPEFWPVVLVLIGLYILIGRVKPHKTPDGDINSENFNDVSIFGGGKKQYRINNFRGGNITAVFGGSEINLRDCTLAEGKNVLDIFAIFGGTEIHAPAEWKIEMDLVPIFGGFSDNRRLDPNLVQSEERVLKIKGIVIFGGGEINN
jgi:predicted membrane protein